MRKIILSGNQPLAGIPVERTGIPLCWDGTKNVPAKFFPYTRNGTNKRYIHAWRDPGKRPVPANVTSRLLYKQPLRYLCMFSVLTSRGLWNVPFISSAYLVHVSVLKQLKNPYSSKIFEADMAFSAALRSKVNLIVVYRN